MCLRFCAVASGSCAKTTRRLAYVVHTFDKIRSGSTDRVEFLEPQLFLADKGVRILQTDMWALLCTVVLMLLRLSHPRYVFVCRVAAGRV